MKVPARMFLAVLQSTKPVRRLGKFLGVVLLMSVTAAAQDASMESKLDVYLGYSFLHNKNFDGTSPASGDAIGRTGNHGYDVRLTYNRSKLFGIETDFAGNHGSSSSTSSAASVGGLATTSSSHLNRDFSTLLFGPRLTRQAGDFRPYFHFLAGVAHGHAGIDETLIVTLPDTLPGGPDVVTSNLSSSGKATGFGFAVGGGVDWIRGRWAVKILEANFEHAGFNGNVTSVGTQTCASTGTACGNSFATTSKGPVIPNGFRLTTGIIFRFARR